MQLGRPEGVQEEAQADLSQGFEEVGPSGSVGAELFAYA